MNNNKLIFVVDHGMKEGFAMVQKLNELEKESAELEKKIKQNQEDIEKNIRSIYKFKDYGDFIISKVHKYDFKFNKIKKDNDRKDESIDEACKSILSCYDLV